MLWAYIISLNSEKKFIVPTNARLCSMCKKMIRQNFHPQEFWAEHYWEKRHLHPGKERKGTIQKRTGNV